MLRSRSGQVGVAGCAAAVAARQQCKAGNSSRASSKASCSLGTRYQLIEDLAAASGRSLSLSWRQLGYWDWLPTGGELSDLLSYIGAE